MQVDTKPIISTLKIQGNTYRYVDFKAFCAQQGSSLNRLPFSLRILLEGVLRNAGCPGFSQENATAVLNWQPVSTGTRPAIPFLPARVLMQDFTGLPVLNDLTALRAAAKHDGKDPLLINPRIPSDLVIDHSVQVQAHACPEAQKINEQLEFKQNYERYQFLKWSQSAYNNLHVLPPGLGICHQVNLEHLGRVAFVEQPPEGSPLIYPDSVLGTDSHTPMINGLGILGWGVGGIEALAAMLAYPTEFPIPDVIGVKLIGALQDTVTPTDLTLTLTSKLREMGVVGCFIEISGESAASLPVETRAMISNMTPESGATATYFPVDEQTIDYLHRTGRTKAHTELVEEYFKAAGLYRESSDEIEYTRIFEFDLNSVEPVIAGPKRPQDLITLSNVKEKFNSSLTTEKGLHGFGKSEANKFQSAKVVINGEKHILKDGTVVIAAITSCTNTSDPSVVITAALLARNAHAAGLKRKPWVKTSFAPGSRVVYDYLEKASLLTPLAALGFDIVGYGCTTCIGNSGPIDPSISKAIKENDLIAAGVLSGNRNFEGRIHPDTQANFLMSPPLVVAYALAGTVDFNFETTPIGTAADGKEIFLKDIYPKASEVKAIASAYISTGMYNNNYANIYNSNEEWNKMRIPGGTIFDWQEDSTLIKEPAFLFDGFGDDGALADIEGAYALAVLRDSITTDHISPAGRIAADNPAAVYLRKHGVEEKEFISFGARRGNDEIMARGTFSNIRLTNNLADGKVGGYTRHIPSGEIMTMFEAAMRYKASNTPLVIIAGKAYGTGSSRDWAAKGTYLQGVQAVIAESYERIHRTNLVCMGILPLQFSAEDNAEKLGLTGKETYTIKEIGSINTIQPLVKIVINRPDGSTTTITAAARIDTPLELAYFKAGGLMRKLRLDC